MHTVRDLTLSRNVTGSVLFFQWSPSSRLVLVASPDEIHVFSVFEEDHVLRATIRNPAPPAAKLVYVGFGASETDVCVCASLGLKFAVFDLTSSKSVEVANPKFHTAASVRKGFCFRPKSQHLTVITRTSGKDMISIHHPKTKELQRSWFPDTVDAQGILWSPDGKWLLTWESAAHGHKVLFYTPDGNLFKTWSGPQCLVNADADIPLGPGVRLLDFSADALNLVIGDSSRRICVLNMTSVTESLRLLHPNSISPTDTLQVRVTFFEHLLHPPTLHIDCIRYGKNKSPAQTTTLSRLFRPYVLQAHSQGGSPHPHQESSLRLSTLPRHSSRPGSRKRQAPYGFGTFQLLSSEQLSCSTEMCHASCGILQFLRPC